ncbi:MAG: hypothetical protein H7Y30_13160 [Pyrinomonadaceae bacterium]|nr:hypothetical protein [Pyrinomonadaceae bacterium]
MHTLEHYRGHDFIGVEELASAAASLVERYNQEPERGNVRLAITTRIVRHYLSEDLLGDPTGQAGASTVFNYGNLLRLLAVKKLLADNWSVVKIREFMSVLDITALEHLVNSALSPSSSNQQPQKKQDTGRVPSRAPNIRAAQQRRLPELPPARAPLFAAPSAMPSQPPPLASLVIESARRAERRAAEWVEIATGLEVKVRRSFRPPRTQQEREKLAARFWAVVNKKEELPE